MKRFLMISASALFCVMVLMSLQRNVTLGASTPDFTGSGFSDYHNGTLDFLGFEATLTGLADCITSVPSFDEIFQFKIINRDMGIFNPLRDIFNTIFNVYVYIQSYIDALIKLVSTFFRFIFG